MLKDLNGLKSDLVQDARGKQATEASAEKNLTHSSSMDYLTKSRD
ncbi:hypothetical protein ACFP7A_08370 [Sporolactobacillus kofuensis]|uniref:Uncharacterized protein n=1 Tax=Sporolactobacillus kofuensis TaxID=269672 RepID=A0ABW1WHD5_9BACL|nr:hypothetical protein [Sporolactobacillus kofuensis]